MAAIGSLQNIFDNPLYPQAVALTSCMHITPMKLLHNSPTDVFSRLNLNEKTKSDDNLETSSQAIGFESFNDVKDFNDQWEDTHEHIIEHTKNKMLGEPQRSRMINRKPFPPPISSFGRWGCLKSYRFNGRLVLKEEKIVTREMLHAYREDGRLKMRYIRFHDSVEVTQDHRSKIW
ncbi:hypothetical protein R6Q59_027807 [Mikania micrantha]